MPINRARPAGQSQCRPGAVGQRRQGGGGRLVPIMVPPRPTSERERDTRHRATLAANRSTISVAPVPTPPLARAAPGLGAIKVLVSKHTRRKKVQSCLTSVHLPSILRHMKMDTDHYKVSCKRCGWRWFPRKDEVRQCPKCKSAWWDVAREKRRAAKEEALDVSARTMLSEE